MAEKQIIGWKLYYTTGLVVSSKETEWATAPSHDVLGEKVFYQETYDIYRDGKLCTEHYSHIFFGQDYYWQYGCGNTHDVPEGASVKLGKEVPREWWWAAYNRMHQDQDVNF